MRFVDKNRAFIEKNRFTGRNRLLVEKTSCSSKKFLPGRLRMLKLPETDTPAGAPFVPASPEPAKQYREFINQNRCTMDALYVTPPDEFLSGNEEKLVNSLQKGLDYLEPGQALKATPQEEPEVPSSCMDHVDDIVYG